MKWYNAGSAVAAALLAAACSPDGTGPSGPGTVSPGPGLVVGSSGGVAGAAFTSTNPTYDRPGGSDGGSPTLCYNGQDLQAGTNNCNLYGAKEYVWFNGGPAAAQLEDGNYFFAVLAPGGQHDPNDGTAKNLSTSTIWSQRTFNVTGTTFTYTGVSGHIASGGMIRLFPYADTPNPGGVYIMALCRVPTAPSATNAPGVDPSECKYDAFKIRTGTGIPNDDLDANIFITATATNGVGEPHVFDITVTAFGGTAPYSYAITSSVTPAPGTSSNTCATPTVSGSVATCTLTINSTSAGVFTASASATVTDATPVNSVTVSTDNTNGNSGPAVKTYVAAELTWRKNDDAGNPLGGATFQIQRIFDRFGVATTTPLITGIVDCVALPCAGSDTDARAGYFKVVGLSFGTWRITETAAPLYYDMASGHQDVAITNLASPSGAAALIFVNPLHWFGETATGFGLPWKATRSAPDNWFMYSEWSDIADGGTNLIAGQRYTAGRITGSRGSVANSTSLTITLAPSGAFRFAGVSNNVKIHPMSCTTNQKYVQPGQFSVKRSAAVSATTITVSGLANTLCYGIHVDVERNPLLAP